ncbi:phosphatase PAP2 family protein [Pseudobdellovibrio exovorus]|uniref:Phosphatidic acid phosphatase type 2/haloperoxidase domain-containing protein n=1 Tax=Pseudobdellovibrio exovorus JSS TaxID=1184267 RepID=M4VBQ9_9BACT|nr:phosphatase PAP2 family protein [Pseudobdellovibrio exovorus]AGH95461.1 hypothetical protein A11Q_1245 [Pseudobdellovibrio exovorus JSS]
MHFSDRRKLIIHTVIILALAIVTVAIGAYQLDQFLALFFSRESMQTVYYYSREITEVGNSVHYFVISIVGILFTTLLYPRISFLRQKLSAARNEVIKYWSFFLLKALLLCGLFLHLGKFGFGRLRPHASDSFNPLSFDPLNFHHHWQSFPSGHSQVLFTAATTALLIWPRYRFVFLLIAAFFAFTRVTIHQHFFSDTVGGAAIGYLTTLWIYHIWPPKDLQKP